jgi:hypothetical protein
MAPVPVVVPVFPAGELLFMLLVVVPVLMSVELPVVLIDPVGVVLIEPVGVVMPEFELYVGLLMFEFDVLVVVDVEPLL